MVIIIGDRLTINKSTLNWYKIQSVIPRAIPNVIVIKWDSFVNNFKDIIIFYFIDI